MSGVEEKTRNLLADPEGEFWQKYMAPIKAAKQQLFVLEYIKDFNGAEAVRRAGYKTKHTAQMAKEMLEKPLIGAAVEAAKAYRVIETATDATYVLVNLREMYELDPLEILNEDCTLRPLSDWPLPWRRSITGMEINESILRGTDSAEETVAVLKKIKWPEKLKILELIGKHTDVRAFVEQREINGSVTVQGLIDELTGS